MSEAFVEGDLAMLIDPKERHYLVRLANGKSFHTHLGAISHDTILGTKDGGRLYTPTGHEITVLRPTLAEFILKMKRQAQVIYPKDIGPIILYGDVFPGAQVLEAGLGSGAMTMALLRAVGPSGHVTTYEIRGDLAAQGLRNIREFLGEVPNFTLKMADVYAELDERDVDRVIMDVPEPWMAVAALGESLRTGGILISYLPTVLQVHQLHQALTRNPRFDFVEAFEVLHRPWHLSDRSVRPAHRMVAHTGFIVRAVSCQPRRARTATQTPQDDIAGQTQLPG